MFRDAVVEDWVQNEKCLIPPDWYQKVGDTGEI